MQASVCVLGAAKKLAAALAEEAAEAAINTVAEAAAEAGMAGIAAEEPQASSEAGNVAATEVLNQEKIAAD